MKVFLQVSWSLQGVWHIVSDRNASLSHWDTSQLCIYIHIYTIAEIHYQFWTYFYIIQITIVITIIIHPSPCCQISCHPVPATPTQWRHPPPSSASPPRPRPRPRLAPRTTSSASRPNRISSILSQTQSQSWRRRSLSLACPSSWSVVFPPNHLWYIIPYMCLVIFHTRYICKKSHLYHISHLGGAQGWLCDQGSTSPTQLLGSPQRESEHWTFLYSGGNTGPHSVSRPIPIYSQKVWSTPHGRSDTSHNLWTWRPFRRYICDLLVEIYPIYINYINYTHPSFCRLTSLAMGRPCHNRLSTRKRFRNKTKKCLLQKIPNCPFSGHGWQGGQGAQVALSPHHQGAGWDSISGLP